MIAGDDRQLEHGPKSASTPQRLTRPKNPTFLIIGYGNQLRSDDGIGPRAAAGVEQWKLPQVRTIVCHQLTPELARPISSAERVIFIDATLDPGDSVEVRVIKPKATAQIMAHAANPQSLLGLAKALFGRSPCAHWLTIPIENTAFGEELSPKAQQGLQIALKKIRELVITKKPTRL